MGLRRLQKKLDFHGIERKDDPAALGAVKHTGVQQRRHVAVDSLHVSAYAPGSLAYRHRTGSAQYLQQLPPLFGQHLPKQFGRGKADTGGPLRRARFPRLRSMSRWKSAINFSGVMRA